MGRRAHPPKWFVFFFFSLYYTDINCSTIGDPHYCQQKSTVCSGAPTLTNNHPEPRKTSVRTCFQGLWPSFDHQQPTTPENECSRSFLGVAGFLWPPPPINNPTSPKIECLRSFSEIVGFLWASATVTTINNPQNPRNQVFALDFGCYYPSESNPQKRVFVLVVGSLPAATTTTAQ